MLSIPAADSRQYFSVSGPPAFAGAGNRMKEDCRRVPTLTPTPTLRRLTAVLGATALVAGFCTASAFAQHQEQPTGPGAPTNTLDLTLNTGATTAPAAEKKTTVASSSAAPKAKAAPPKKATPARRSSGRRGLSTLPSRAASQQRGEAPATGTPPPKVAQGRLGRVSVDSATLRAGRETSARPLSIVQRGANLAVVQETDSHYGVLMIDQTVGWIPKASVELIDYQVEIQFPAQPEAPAAPSPSGQPGAEQYAGAGALSPHMEALLREAFSYLGVRYVWAGNTRNGLDCSAFVKNVFGSFGVSLPRHSGDQITKGATVASVDELQPGDRLYFDMKKAGRINHCGIYIGNGYFIHASSNQKQVGVDRIDKSNYRNGLVAARRDWKP